MSDSSSASRKLRVTVIVEEEPARANAAVRQELSDGSLSRVVNAFLKIYRWLSLWLS
jgi:hypothetical protein